MARSIEILKKAALQFLVALFLMACISCVNKPAELSCADKGLAYAIQGKFTEAKKEFELALFINPRLYYVEARLESIKDAIEQKIKKEATIHLFKAVYYSKHTMLASYSNKIIDEFDKAIAIEPNYADAYEERGLEYFLKGQFDQAILDYNKAIEINPKKAYFYLNRGVAYFTEGQFDQAILDYNKVIEINPPYFVVEAYRNRGISFFYKGQYDLALSDCNMAIGLYPGFAKVYLTKALIFDNLGRINEAIEAYNDFIKYAQNQPEFANDIKVAKKRIKQLNR